MLCHASLFRCVSSNLLLSVASALISLTRIMTLTSLAAQSTYWPLSAPMVLLNSTVISVPTIPPCKLVAPFCLFRREADLAGNLSSATVHTGSCRRLIELGAKFEKNLKSLWKDSLLNRGALQVGSRSLYVSDALIDSVLPKSTLVILQQLFGSTSCYDAASAKYPVMRKQPSMPALGCCKAEW